MREELVTPVTARRLAAEGLGWEPQIGDWCTVFGAEHIGETQAGVCLVIGLAPAAGLLALVDAEGRWPISQVPARDCLWLPTAGKLKTWLRGHGYRVAAGEASAALLGSTTTIIRHVCRLTRADGAPPLDGEGASEPDALADAILRILGAQTADSTRQSW